LKQYLNVAIEESALLESLSVKVQRSRTCSFKRK
jgi:hypothetical protein